MFLEDPIVDAVLGLIGAGLVFSSLLTGKVGLPRMGVLEKEKAPRAFWFFNLLFATLAAYLIYSGAVALMSRHTAQVTVIWHGEPKFTKQPTGATPSPSLTPPPH